MRIVALAIAYVCVPAILSGQTLLDRDSHHRAVVGFGLDAGVAGATYSYRLGRLPLELGGGLGADGVAGHIRLALPGIGTIFKQGEGDTYLGLMLLAGTGGVVSGSGTLALELAERSQLPSSRIFIVAGFSIARPLWGQPNYGMMGLMFPHLGVGYAF